jgi:hypothetical protein
MRIPACLVKRASAAKMAFVTRWWSALSHAEQRALRRDEATPPRGLVVRFVEPAEAEEEDDLYAFLVNHELSFPPERTFHICTAHPEARAVVDAGRIPADFRCPRGEASCPMRAIVLAAGKSVRLVRA